MDLKIIYRGENGDGWIPTSMRDVWNYAVRTGQVVVPPALSDGGPWLRDGIDSGDTLQITWIPPEYEGRLSEAAPPLQPTYLALDELQLQTPTEAEPV